MKLNIIEDEPKNLIIEFDEVDRGVAELIKDKLYKNKEVEFVTVMQTHPETGKPRLIVKSTKNARTLVLKSLEDLQEEFKELTSQFPKK
ncbi:MAG: hypothetical protein M1122_02280 [Candidatus Marsarchaeota archaeon]|jgi:DNA-directed RNA polymerase subunit L|nr:hypothetical protein [Candidatus Marsarchaeota archaeon]